MNAQTCDRCGVVWYDSEKCKVDIETFEIHKTDSKSDDTYDLCEHCQQALFKVLAPICNIPTDDKTIRLFK